MPDVNKDRLFPALYGPILHCVEEGKHQESAMTNYRYPSLEEIERVERAARRARAEEVARLAKAAAAGVRALFLRPAGVGIKGARHA